MIAKVFCVVLGVAAGMLVGTTLYAAEQSGRLPRIGVLWTSLVDPWVKAFHEGLRENGYVDGVTAVVDIRATGENLDLGPRLAEELIALEPDAIYAVPAALVKDVLLKASNSNFVRTGLGEEIRKGLPTCLENRLFPELGKSVAQDSGITGLAQKERRNLRTYRGPWVSRLAAARAKRLKQGGKRGGRPSEVRYVQEWEVEARGVLVHEVPVKPQTRRPRHTSTVF